MSLNPYEPGWLTPASGPERLAGVVSHASLLFGLPFVVPLAVLLLYPVVGGASDYVRHQSMQALLWHCFALIIGGGLWGATWALWAVILIGWPFALVLTVVSGIFTVWTLWIALVATFKAFQGQPYRLPVVGGLGS